MSSSWVYLNLSVIAALIVLGAVAINTAINHNAISVNTALNEANAQLTLAQLDSRLLPQTIRFAELSDDILENNPRLKEVLREVDIKFRDITEQCPPMRPVYCDIASNTRSTKILTHKEFESLKRTFEFTSVEYSNGRLVWQSYIRDDCSYPLDYPGIKDVNGQQECYYSIILERSE